MNANLSDLTIVVDRSGSMESIRTDAEGGLNHLIDEQKKAPGNCNLTLVQFDNQYECVHSGVRVADVPKFTLVPRGGTALLDAVGRAVNETGARLAAMREEDRPANVIFVIVTDGGENASREFTKSKVSEMVKRQTEAYKWKFTYIGANQDAFAEAAKMGISRDATLLYAANAAGTRSAYKAVSDAVLMACAAPDAEISYSAEARAKAVDSVN